MYNKARITFQDLGKLIKSENIDSQNKSDSFNIFVQQLKTIFFFHVHPQYGYNFLYSVCRNPFLHTL